MQRIAPGIDTGDRLERRAAHEQALDRMVGRHGQIQAGTVKVDEGRVVLEPLGGVDELDATGDDDALDVLASEDRSPRQLIPPVLDLVVIGAVLLGLDIRSADEQRVRGLIVAPPGVLDAGAVLEAAARHGVPRVQVDLQILGTIGRIDGGEVARAVVPAPVLAQPLAIGHAMIGEAIGDARVGEYGLEA